MEYRRRRVITMFLLAGIVIVALAIYAAWQLAQSSHSPQGNGEALAALWVCTEPIWRGLGNDGWLRHAQYHSRTRPQAGGGE